MNSKGHFIVEGAGIRKEKLGFKNKFGEVEVEAPHVDRELVERSIDRIKLAREKYLLGTPVRKIVKTIDKATSNLSDRNHPLRKEAEEVLPVTTGLSPQMLSLCMDGLAGMFREDNLLEMLCSELDNPEYLDGFRKSGAGESRAYGKELVVNVFGSGGVPGVQILGIVTALLTKSAVLSKPDSGEPVLPSIYSRAIADVDPGLAECLACFPWKGGGPEYADVETVVFGKRGGRDAVVVYGSVEIIREVRERVSPDCTFIAYPPRTGLIMAGKEKLSLENSGALAERIAWDVCSYDQKACFSPQYIYVEEGGEVAPEEFAGALAEKMDEIGRKYPVGETTGYAKARMSERKRTYMLQESLDSARIFEPEGGLVIYDKNRALETPITYRTVHVMPVRDFSEVPEMIKSFENNIQTIGIEAGKERFREYSDKFSSIGDISRITVPGKMCRFPVSIHHDGRRNYDGLLRWVDRIF